MKNYPYTYLKLSFVRLMWRTLFCVSLIVVVEIQSAWSQCNPAINLSPATNSVCVTDAPLSLTITGTTLGGSSGSWGGFTTNPPPSTSTTFDPAVEGPGSHLISWTVDVALGTCLLGETATTTIVVDGDNSALTPGTSVVFPLSCVGDMPLITPTATSATFSSPTFNFSIDVGTTTATGATVSTGGFVDVTGPGQVGVLVTETNLCGTSAATTVLITFNSNPDLSVSGSPATVCADAASTGITLSTTFTPTTLVDYLITNVPANTNIVGLMLNDILGPGTGIPVPVPMLADTTMDGSITYTFVSDLNDGSLCTSLSQNVTINVEAIPHLIPIPSSETICSGEATNVLMTTNHSVPANVQFVLTGFDVSTAPNVAGNTLTPGTVSVPNTILVPGDILAETLTNSGTSFETVRYIFTPVRTDGLQCVGPPVSIPITVDPLPDLVPNPTSQTICSGEAFSIEMTSNTTPDLGPVDLEFLVTGITSNPNLDEANTIVLNQTVLPLNGFLSETLTNSSATPQTVTYTLRPQLNSSRTNPADPTTATCFGATVDITITVNPTPTASASVTGPNPICQGESTTVDGTPLTGPAPFTHFWEVMNPQPSGFTGTGTVDGAQTSINQMATFLADQPGMIRLLYTTTDANGCPSAPVPIDLEIHPNPVVGLSGVTNLCLEGMPASFTGTPTDANGVFTTTASAGLTDNGDGTATFNPQLSGNGTFDITFTYTDPLTSCTAFITQTFTVDVCNTTATLIDPCSCRESSPGSQGNATTLTDGQFEETVRIFATTGISWHIVSATGFFDPSSPQPPLLPTPIATGPSGVLLTEGPAGVYNLLGVHVDALGYTITLTNGTDTLTASNTCFYPNPTITDLRDGYCTNNVPVPLTGNAAPSTGTGIFDILQSDGVTVVQSNATVFDPTLLPVGNYVVRFTFDEMPDLAPCTNCNPGCVQAVEQAVAVVDAPNTIVCNDLVNATLGTDCLGVITPDMILEGDSPSYGIFDVEIFDGSINLGNTVGAAQIGKTLPVRVTENCNGNFCWGTILIEDKMAPVFDCVQDTVRIGCTADLNAVPPPVVTDNCEVPITPILIGDNITNFGCTGPDSVIQRVVRFWRAEDSQGNMSTTCQQVVDIVRSSLDQVVFPLSLDGNALPALDCSVSSTEPSVTGFPLVNGQAVDGTDFCAFTVSHQDLVFNSCGGSFKIFRTWTVFDWCAGLISGVNPAETIQIIEVVDNTPPSLSCPADLTVGANQANCTATQILPMATITDNCSSFTVTTSSVAGSNNENGGLLTDLPLGTVEITYTAIDDCGNTASCTMNLTVIDDMPPVAVCDEFTIVTLNAVGVAGVNAMVFDDGSFDNCTPVTFDVKRMDDPGDFGPQVFFDCTDAGSTVTVILRVTDQFGNSNNCMVSAVIQDKIAPAMTCPSDITIECTFDPNDLNITGNVVVDGNCPVNTISMQDISNNVNQCGVGFIVRQFTAEDASGNVSTCNQTITIVNSNPFDSTDISFPQDFFTADCTSAASLSPDSLPTSPVNFSRPLFQQNSCALVAVAGPFDEILTVTDTACFKILRTWKIMDFCQSDTVMFEHVQVIVVMDTLPPILTCPADLTVDITSIFCVADVTLPVPVVDDCNPNVSLSFSGDLGTGPLPMTIPNVPAGVYNVMYHADDGCLNSSSCTFQVTVRDGKKPSPLCQQLVTELMPTSGTITVDPSIFDAGSTDNCPGVLQFSFSSDVNDTLRTFTCDSLGFNTLEFWVTDPAGNQDFCVTQLEIQDNTGVCGAPQIVTIGGTVETEENQTVAQVDVAVNGSADPTAQTGTAGSFLFENLPAGGDFTVTPTKDINLLNGVSTFDLSLIGKHILGITPLSSPYKMIAADVNNSGTISTLDLVQLRKTILMIDDHFPNNTSWRFIDAAYAFPNPSNPFGEVFPEVISFNNLNSDAVETNFIAVKIGDVNGNANPENFFGSDDRSDNSLPIEVENRLLKAGEEVELEFSVHDFQYLEGYQFALEFDPNSLQFIEIGQNGVATAENFGLTMLERGLIATSWNKMNFDDFATASLDAKTVLFSIRFRATQAVLIENALSINPAFVHPEAYRNPIPGMADNTEEIEQLKVHLQFDTPALPDFELFQNQPNPFYSTTTIYFNLPENSNVNLRIMDLSGKVIREQPGYFEKGIGSFTLSAKDLGTSGVLFYQLQTPFGNLVKKMVLSK